MPSSPSLLIDILPGWRRRAASGMLIGAMALAGAPAALAQNAADLAAAARNADRQQRAQEVRPQGDPPPRDGDGASARRPAQIVVTAPMPAAAAPAAAPGCIAIDRIAIGGAPHLSAAARARLAGAYAGRCLSLTDIEHLLADVVADYSARGQIAARAYVRQQDASTGRLEVLVVEGTLQRLDLDDDGAGSVAVDHVFPGLLGKPLNLRDLEQGLEQLNRLESNYATLDVQPGDQVGASVVAVHNQPLERVRLVLSADNLGDRSTGRNRVGLRVSVDNPFGVNDYFSFTQRRALPYGEGGTASSTGNALYELPYGYSTFSVGAGKSSYSGDLFTAGGQAVASRGDNTYLFGRAGRVLYRDQYRRANVATTLTVKNAKNYLDGQYLSVSSRKLAVWDNDASLSLRGRYGELWGQFGVSVGLDRFGARDDPPDLEAGAPRAQFRKLRYDAAYTLPFKLGRTDFMLTSDVSAQRGIDVLYGSEQLLVGGVYNVRGFGNGVFIGDSGFTVRNELSATLPLSWQGKRRGLLRPYVGLDYGRVFMRGPDSFGGYLSGVAAGVRMDVGAVSTELFAAQPLDMSRGAPRDGGRLYLQLRLYL